MPIRTEILIAALVFGVLIVLGLINIKTLISRAKSVEANIQLERIYKLEKDFSFKNGRYSYDLNEIGFTAEKLVSEGGSGHYKIKISKATHQNFVANATSTTDFDGDGKFNVWEINEQKDLIEITPD